MTAMVKLACTTLTLMLLPFLYPTGLKEEVGQLEPSLEELVVESYPRMIDSYFIQNVGQMDSDEILFYSRGGNVFFTPRGVTFRFREMEPIYDDAFGKELSSLDKFGRPPDRYRERGVVINYTFVGANHVMPRGRERCSWNTNYFKGNDPNKWFPHVPNYKEVVYENVWDGIDIVYRITENGVKYDIIIHPGSDPTKIGFELSGHERILVNNVRELVIETKYWDILDSGLVAYYLNEEDNLIDCGFQIKDDNVMGYNVEPYDTTRPVVIDPLIYSTLIGGADMDYGYGIVQDKKGNITITGSSYDAIIDYPTTTGAYDIIQNGRSAAFITKFKSDLSSLIYSTFLEGSSKEEDSFGYDIILDANDYPYITGRTGSSSYSSCTFPTTKGAYCETYNYHGDIFLTKLNQNGSALVYSTLIGGSGSDRPDSLMLDPTSNNVYITGYTKFNQYAYPIIDYPTTEGSYDRSLNGDGDVFISVIDSLGMRLLYSTLIGGSSNLDWVEDQVLDVENDSVIITGYTRSSNYPTTNGSYDRTFGGSEEIFISKFNLNLSTLLSSTFVGGNNVDEAYGIDLDSEGNIYITGCTGGDFPVTENAFDTSPNGNIDVFVTKFDPTLSSIIYSTYIGGNQDDIAYDIVVNEKGYAIITGATKEASVLYPTTKGAFDRELSNWDVFITLLNENGSSLEYSTYIGEIQSEWGTEISLDHDRNVTIIGDTGCYKNGFPTTENAYNRINNGRLVIFVLKMYLIDDSTPPCFGHDNSDTEATTGDPFTFNVSISDDERRVTNANVLFRYGNFSYTNVSLEGNGNYTYTIYVPIYSLLPFTYYFYAMDYAKNVNTTVPRTVEVRDNDRPVFVRDLSWKSGTTGEPVTFEVDVRDNIAVSSVQVEYWGKGEHLFANLTGVERYSVTVNVPEDTVTMNYIFHAVDTSGNWNNTGKRSFDIRDNDAPYFGPDITSNVGYTGNVFSFISDARDNIGIFDVSIEYWFDKGYRYNESMKGVGPYIFNVTVPEDSLDTLYYRYSVVDVNGLWNNTEVKEVRIEDDDPPVFGRETFSDLVTTGDEFEIELVVKDNIGVQGVYLEHWFGTEERTNVSMKGFGPYMTKVQVPKSTEGLFNYVFHSFDEAGNWGRTGVRTRTVYDNDGPIFGIDNTDKDCTTGDPFTFRTGVSDNIDVKELFVEYWFGTGRHTNLSMTGTDGYVCSITIPPSPSMTLWYKFVAVDEDANWAETREMKVTVLDNDAPEIGTDQTPSAVNTGEQFQFKMTASDNIGIVEAMIIYRFGEGKETSAKMSGLGYYMAIRTFTYDLSLPVNTIEPINYRIVLTDQAGNSVECDGTVMVRDSIGPVADAGADIVVKQGTTVVLNGSMSTDNIGITNWTWRWEEGPEEVVLEGISVIYRFKREGTYIVTLTVKDGSGNVGTDTMTVVVEKTDGKDRSYQFFSLLVILPLISLITTLLLIIKRKRKQSIGKEMRTEMAGQKPL